ncbi:Bis(5'-adenosyl)-triphosphatase enpp4 [Trichinella papuae]|uniref:Bis(5'-adenosyl)-triphosphatase enpp4 n=1 Tax=Trichinella papuae TaxID=268474 RepID=A0A0V1MYP6_9BILA|nr:Bis(5'-adenosyl)-triphosphatase enpp4 [Trichinella papuae]
MKAIKFQTILCIISLFLLSSLAKQCKKHITILISLDGFRADYVNRLFLLKNHNTFIGELMMGSAYAFSGIRSAFPSITFPNHLTMATGKYVDEHGIVSKNFYMPSKKRTVHINGMSDSEFWEIAHGEPIWASYAKMHEQSKVACISWFGCDKPYHGIKLTNYISFNMGHSWTYLVDKLVSYLQNGVEFVLMYFPEPDNTGHHYGPHSHHMDKKLLEIDDNVGYLISSLQHAGFYDKANIILTSDHGMATVKDEVVIPPRHDFKIWSEHDSFWLIQPNPGKTAEVKAYLKSFNKHNYFEVFEKQNLPERYHFQASSRIPKLIIMAKPGYVLHTHHKGKLKGQHGYKSGHYQMKTLFIARGPSFLPFPVSDSFCTKHTAQVVKEALCIPQHLTTSQKNLLNFVKSVSQ